MQPNASNAAIMNLLPLGLVFLVFYFLLIKPQKKQQQEHKKMLDALKKNDEVVTTGGIHGVIISVKDSTVMVRIDDTSNAKVEVDKAAIAYLKKKNQPEGAK